MNQYKTLIILDWDDTLFPTSWIVKNNINLTNKDVQNKYIVYFSRLDTLLYELFMKMLKCGQVIIVTNAALKWLIESSNIIPNTQKILKNNVLILSARDTYQKDFPDQMHLWKKMMFSDITTKYFKGYIYQNIISVGDAEYEFNATIDLYNEHSVVKNKLLKTVKLMKNPTFESLIDQLEVLTEKINNIVTTQRHMDLQFQGS